MQNRREAHVLLGEGGPKIWTCSCWEKGNFILMNSNMVKPEKFGHLRFFYHFTIPLSNYKKYILFPLKSSFGSEDIEIFVFMSSPLFFPDGHCFGGWSNINLKVYDVINCLNKNLMTHFVWYLHKENNEKRYDIEILSIDRIWNKETFYEEFIQKMCTKSYSQTSF